MKGDGETRSQLYVQLGPGSCTLGGPMRRVPNLGKAPMNVRFDKAIPAISIEIL